MLNAKSMVVRYGVYRWGLPLIITAILRTIYVYPREQRLDKWMNIKRTFRVI